jgi:large subunit ribosomal protein L21
MYAVIRAGGKQYRVAPGDVIRVETVQDSSSDGKVAFGDVLAVSAGDGQVSKPGADVHVSGEIVEQNRSAKILVFHYKRKKQYKKLQGHRQPYTAVRITEIAFGGQKYSAPELPKKVAKPKKTKAAVEDAPEAKAPSKKAAAKKTAVKKAAPKKKK